MPDVNIPRASEAHPELFHYTDEDGLTGILKSQCLWATHWRFLNDAKELELFCEAFPRLIKPVLDHPKVKRSLGSRAVNVPSRQSDVVDALCEALHRRVDDMRAVLLHPDETRQFFEFYIASFCTPEGDYPGVREHGLLSQWRQYGKNGGYALVFDTLQLEHLIQLEVGRWPCFLSLGDVVYSSDSPAVVVERLEALPELVCAALDLISSPSRGAE